MTTYRVGGATGKWGRTWTRGQLDTTNFRVRIANVTTAANKAFSLDWLGVQLSYTR